MFTKKHYEEIAKIIRAEIVFALWTSRQQQSAKNIAYDLADYFVKNNPKFDRDKFLKACRIED